MDCKDELYGIIVKKQYNRVVTFFKIRLNDSSLAEDFSQEVFAALWRSMDELMADPETNYTAWIMATSRNQLCKYIERKTVETKHKIEVPDYGGTVDFSSTDRGPEEKTVDEDIKFDERERLIEASKMLSESDRDLFRMFYIENCDYTDLSDYLQLDESTVRVKISRLRQKVYRICVKLGFFDVKNEKC